MSLETVALEEQILQLKAKAFDMHMAKEVLQKELDDSQATLSKIAKVVNIKLSKANSVGYNANAILSAVEILKQKSLEGKLL